MSEIMSNPILPNLKKEILIMFKNEFLKLNSLKIGDSIMWSFGYQELKSAYKGSMNSYSICEKSEGVLKENKEGFLYVESVKEYSFYTHIWNQRSGRQSRHTWKRTMKKAKHFFGTGSIHLMPDE